MVLAKQRPNDLYNDDKVLWARHRRQVYVPSDQATILLGSSRIKFDVDIATWKEETGEKAIQLTTGYAATSYSTPPCQRCKL